MSSRTQYSRIALLCAFLVVSVATAKPPTPDYSNVESINSGVGNSIQAYQTVLNEVPCNVANVIDAMVNVNTPTTRSEIKNNSEFHQVAESESIFHNFQEGVLSEGSSADEVSRAIGRATAEYWLERAGWMSKSEWQVLDPDLPNVKYVSNDGFREAVYNRHTGEKVNGGINAGTVNVAKGSRDWEHWYSNKGGDIGRFTRCKTPNELQQELARFLSKHPELIPPVFAKETFLRQTVEPDKQCTSVQQPNHHSLSRDNSNSDWDCCKCANPDDRDFYCQKCGKMSSWLAPREDPKFLEFLNKGARK